MGKYLRPEYLAWQLPLMGLFLVGWLLGGAYLLRRMFNRRLPRRALTFSRCAQVSLLAGGAAWFGAAVVYFLIVTIAERLDTKLNYVGLVPAAAVAVVMFHVVLHASFELPLPVVLTRGSVVIGAILLLGLATGAGVFLPAQRLFLRKVRRERSRENLYRINQAVLDYEKARAKAPPTLSALAESGVIRPELLRCPSIPGRPVGYFYLPLRSAHPGRQTEKLRACEFTNDETRPARLVLFINGQVLPVPPADFHRLLALPENRRFAAKFRQADKPS